jgi:hypothetical protein
VAAPYWYLVPFEEDLQQVLDALREREFRAGRYNPVMPKLDFAEPKFSRQYRAAQHDSIEDAIMDAGEEGTRSILDIHTLVDHADDADFGVASPLPRAALQELYGTLRPTTKTVRSNKEFLRWAFPAQCIYFPVYDAHADVRPAHVLFAGRAFG